MFRIQYLVYIPSIIGLSIVLVALLAKNYRKKSIFTFALMTATVLVWLICQLIADTSADINVSLLFLRLAFVVSLLIPYWFLLFCRIFGYEDKKLFDYRSIIALIPPILIALFSFGDINISQISIQTWGAQIEKTGPVYTLGLIYYILYVVLALTLIARKIKKVGPIERNQIRFIIFGISIAAFLNLFSSYILVFMGFSEYSVLLGTIILPTFLVVVSVAIIRHKLFDIRLVVARTITYLLSIGILIFLYGLIAFRIAVIFIGDASESIQQIFYALLAVILALTFAPLKRFFEKMTNSIFYRNHYDAQSFINEIGHLAASEIDLDKLSRKIITEVIKQMKLEKAEIVVFGEKQLFYENNTFKIDNEAISQKELRKLGRVITLYEDLNSGERKELMHKYGIAVSVALTASDKFIGYLLLGPKLSGDIYTGEDVRVLKIIGSELSVAVQNALSYKEIQLFSETLAERVRQRTAQLKSANDQLKILDQAKDEFISMASHQLRTPLTTVKGYASMLDEGDFGKLTKEQKEPVQLALDGANRMARLIDDLLNISRMDANRFFLEVASIDLAKVVDQEIAQLQNIAQAKNVKLNYTPPKDKIPEIRLDENKTRQVIMNLVDNAIHYSQPPKGGGEVNVSLELDGQHAVFLVKDNGIGVPEKVKNRLFTKMFRANNAKELRPDGTGLGLYLVKRVVQDEGGELIFESIEGKGSTFGFKLPLSGVPKDIEDKSRKIGAKVAATQHSQ